MTDPDDPLRGRDPYPRERIEGLHRERAELLEEIVSTPGPGKQPASTPSKVLLAIGVAAALVIVGGGAWLVGNTGDDDSGDRVAAASSTTPTPTPTPTPMQPTSSSPASRGTSPTMPQRAVKVVGHHCGRLRASQLQRVLTLRSRHAKDMKLDGHARYYLVLKKHGCVVRLGPRHHH